MAMPAHAAMQAANKCAKTAEKIWDERNKRNEEWIDSIPELRARKNTAARQQWKHLSQPKARVPRKRSRVQQKKDEREEQRKEARTRVDGEVEVWAQSRNREREEL